MELGIAIKFLIGFIVSVVFSDGVTPVPIPNTEVKPTSTDDSRKAKVGDRGDNAANFLLEKISESLPLPVAQSLAIF